MAHSHEKTGGCSRSSYPFTCLIYDWPHDCSGRGGDEIIRWLTTEVWQYFRNNICVSGPILVKLGNNFNGRCLSTTFAGKKVFPIEHMKHKGGPIKLVQTSCLDFFCLYPTLYLHSFWNCFVFSSGWQKVHRLPKITVCAKIHS